MIVAADRRGSPGTVTLRFHGGFFRPAPGAGPPLGMDVQFRELDGVRVAGAPGVEDEAASVLGRAARIDVVSASAAPVRLPGGSWARSLSHVLPIDPGGFRRTVAFRGGVLSGFVDPARLESERAHLRDGRDRSFARLTGLSDPEDPYVPLLREAFLEQVARGEGLAPWIEGYTVQVILRARRVVVDGEIDSALTLPSGASLEFRAPAGSHLPHYPANNPHVLEQPPTI